MSDKNTAPPAHITVLLQEAVAALEVESGGVYVDATFGGGGHTQEILAQGGKVIAFDQDEKAIEQGQELVAKTSDLTLVHDNFGNMKTALARLGFEKVDGILFDLGTSALQLEGEGRGFSFNRDEPLDMRMSQDLQVTAKDLVNALGKKELHALFEKYAQEKRARTIAAAIVRARHITPIETTGQLAEIVWNVYGGRTGKLHPATKVFQALRIAVNDELNILTEVLPQALSLLKPDGRMVVISFHEGEDRIVKQTFEQLASEGKLEKINRKPEVSGELELEHNPRARSARMRVVKKL